MEKIANGVYRIRIASPEKHSPAGLLNPDTRLNRLNMLPDIPPPFRDEDFQHKTTNRALTIEIPMDPTEDIYGLGLQLKSFRQTGKKKTLRPNSDPSSDSGDSHAPVPFYVSTKGYGVYADTLRYASFHCGNCKEVDGPRDIPGYESAGTENGIWEIKTGTGNMLIDIPAATGVDIYIFCGTSLSDAVCRYNLFSGGGALPPLWGLGVLYRADMRAGQNELLELARSMRDDGIPCDIFGLEPGWQSHAYSSSYVWDEKRFPDSNKFLSELKAMGYKPNLWEQAYVHPSSPIFKALKPHSGNYYVWDGLIPDFADKNAERIFSEMQLSLVEQGVDGFKLDECDNSDFTSNWGFPDFVHFPSGLDGMQMHSIFGQLFQRAVCKSFNGAGRRTFGQVRAAGALAAPYPFVLYSDLYDHTDFIRGMATAAFSGILWSPEVRQSMTEEEFLLRLQAVILSPQAVINNFLTPQPPWKQYDYEKNRAGEMLLDADRLTAVTRNILNFRMRLVPHLYSAFFKYYLEGLPPIRPLVMDFPEDKNTRDIYDEFMIGEGVLAAPVVFGCDNDPVYLPNGIWYNYHTGEKYTGGQRIAINPRIDEIPLFVKEGTLLALAEPVCYITPDTIFELEFTAFGDGNCSCELFSDDGYSLNYLAGDYHRVTVTVNVQNDISGLSGIDRYSVKSVRRVR